MGNGTQLLVCDSIAWRAELFEAALVRLRVSLAARSASLGLRLGYRTADDLAVLVIEGPGAPAAAELVAWTRLPGLRALEVPPEGPDVGAIVERALGSCDFVSAVNEATAAMHALRRHLGIDDDRRTTLRVGLRLRVRYESHGEWREAETRDVSGAGCFVATRDVPPEIGAHCPAEMFLPDQPWPVKATLQVVRHADKGFGCRLQVAEADDARFQKGVARLRAVPVPDARRREPRVPARLGVRFASGHEFAHAWAENLSRGGLFVRTDTPPPRGSKVSFVLELPGEDDVTIEAEVVHVLSRPDTPGASGCGLAFSGLSDELRARLEDYVAAALARPRARVLVAVPTAARRAELRSAFAALACEVLEASDADGAFAVLLEELLALDALVVADFLEGGSTLPLLARIRRAGGEAELPIMVTLDTRDPGEAERFKAAGASVLFPAATPAPFLAARVVRFVEEKRAPAAGAAR